MRLPPGVDLGAPESEAATDPIAGQLTRASMRVDPVRMDAEQLGNGARAEHRLHRLPLALDLHH